MLQPENHTTVSPRLVLLKLELAYSPYSKRVANDRFCQPVCERSSTLRTQDLFFDYHKRHVNVTQRTGDPTKGPRHRDGPPTLCGASTSPSAWMDVMISAVYMFLYVFLWYMLEAGISVICCIRGKRVY